jgi:transposase
LAQKRRQFTREFKLEAVRLVTEEGRRLSEVARELGIRADMLRKWKQQAESRSGLSGSELSGADVFPGHGKLTSQDEEIRKLRRELELVKQERDFLKKAAAYFAKESR